MCDSNCAYCVNETGKMKKNYIKTFKNKISYFLFLNVWCRFCYRPCMKILHKFNLHYMPPSPMDKYKKFGKIYHKCDWCGLSGYTIRYENNIPTLIDDDYYE